MNAREAILSGIRSALSALAPVPGAHGKTAAPSGLPEAEALRQVLPAVGASFAERVALFARRSAELQSQFRLVGDQAELIAGLKQLRDAEGWTRIATHAGPWTEVACSALGLPVLRTDQPYDKTALEACAVGLTECDALIAQTGSVLVSSRSAGGRALSVLPPHHVVLARRDQLVADLPEAFALLKAKYHAGYPSMISFITGPSRTGDIERTLVLGAHGPKKLTIFCL